MTLKTDRMLSVPEAADHLGVSAKTITRRVADGSLPAFHVGGRAVRIRLADLDRIMVPVPTPTAGRLVGTR